jgi:DNA-binding LacI/PurR family transcriptional regulator
MTDPQDPSLPPAPPGKRPATSTQVARAAGVSRTTVSFVLNNVLDKGISEATRARVLRVAQELGYQPNAAAQSLASGSTGTVALVVPRAEHLYYDQFISQLLASINDECHKLGLKLLVETSQHDSEHASGFVTLVRTRRIDGLIMMNPRRNQIEHLRKLAEAGIPMVVMGSGVPELDTFHNIGQDTRSSAGLAMNHLLGLGHREIAYVGFAGREYFAGAEREQGWRTHLQEAGVEPQEALLEFGEVTAQSGYLATKRMMSRGVRFSALFAGNDTIAFGAMHAIREAGLRIPEDVAVVGYDDIPLAEFAVPPLTTVRSDPIGHGKVAMLELARLLKVGKQEVPAMPEPELVVRQSSGVRTG